MVKMGCQLLGSAVSTASWWLVVETHLLSQGFPHLRSAPWSFQEPTGPGVGVLGPQTAGCGAVSTLALEKT
jgi:hypothetical protein